jgi:hypothetical protein
MNNSFFVKCYCVALSVCSIILSSCGTLDQIPSSSMPGGGTSPDPFFDGAVFCNRADEAGQVPFTHQPHCCETRVHTCTDSSFLFSINKAGRGGSLSVEAGGLLGAELGLSADTRIMVQLKELQRWFATHCKKLNHCENHAAEVCGAKFIEEVRQLTGFIGASQSVNFISEAAIKAFIKTYTVGIDFTATDTSMQVHSGNFYMCSVENHLPCSTFTTVTLNPELWISKPDTSCH